MQYNTPYEAGYDAGKRGSQMNSAHGEYLQGYEDGKGDRELRIEMGADKIEIYDRLRMWNDDEWVQKVRDDFLAKNNAAIVVGTNSFAVIKNITP